MAPRSIPRYGNAPGLGESQEPSSSPSSSGVESFGGAPTVGPPLHKGEKQVGGAKADIYPTPYGGGPSIAKGKSQRRTKGSGDSTGASGSGVIP